MAGAPVGNRNAAKAKVWAAAIDRALERRKPADERLQAIDELADRFLEACFAGEQWALIEFGNRKDGKPAQSVIASGDEEGGPIRLSLNVGYADPPATEG